MNLRRTSIFSLHIICLLINCIDSLATPSFWLQWCMSVCNLVLFPSPPEFPRPEKAINGFWTDTQTPRKHMDGCLAGWLSICLSVCGGDYGRKGDKPTKRTCTCITLTQAWHTHTHTFGQNVITFSYAHKVSWKSLCINKLNTLCNYIILRIL